MILTLVSYYLVVSRNQLGAMVVSTLPVFNAFHGEPRGAKELQSQVPNHMMAHDPNVKIICS